MAALALISLSSALTAPDRPSLRAVGLTSRRAALTGLVALPAAALLPAPSASAAFVQPAPALLEAAAWTPMTKFVRGEALFPDSFVMYMARLFVAFDATAAAWYSAERNRVPPNWSEERASAFLLEKLGTLGASLRYGLLSAGGGDELWARLHASWADKPGAVAQLPLLFSLLATEQQPVEQMRSALRAPPPSDAPAVVRTTFGTVAKFDAAAVIAGLAAAPDGLLPPSVVPQLDKGKAASLRRRRRLPSQHPTGPPTGPHDFPEDPRRACSPTRPRSAAQAARESLREPQRAPCIPASAQHRGEEVPL